MTHALKVCCASRCVHRPFRLTAEVRIAVAHAGDMVASVLQLDSYAARWALLVCTATFQAFERVRGFFWRRQADVLLRTRGEADLAFGACVCIAARTGLGDTVLLLDAEKDTATVWCTRALGADTVEALAQWCGILFGLSTPQLEEGLGKEATYGPIDLDSLCAPSDWMVEFAGCCLFELRFDAGVEASSTDGAVMDRDWRLVLDFVRRHVAGKRRLRSWSREGVMAS